MRIDNGKLILERRPCWQCDGTRRVNEWVTCSACKGTGKKDPAKPKGRNCPICSKGYAHGQVLSIGTAECKACDPDGTTVETITDYAPKSMWQSLTFKVYRSDRHQTYGEYLLGYGCVYSCTDYGRHQKQTDEQLIEHVRMESMSNQACKFVNDNLQVCDHIGIFCNDNGYSVKAVYGKAEDIQKDFEQQMPTDVGMELGRQLAAQGLNGTMLAAKVRTK